VTAEAAQLRVDLPEATVDLSARVVVAADGLRSGILARTEGDPPASAPGAERGGKIGLGAVFDGANPEYRPGVIHMAVGEHGYVGLVRTEDGRLNAAAALKPSSLGRGTSPGEAVSDLLRQASFPPLEGEPAEGWRGTPNLAYHPVRLGGKRVFAVGDAAGYVEPFTGEGMSWALAGAGTLAPIVRRAVDGWREDYLEEWSRAYRKTVGRAQHLCRGVAWTLGRPRLSRTALRVMARFPKIAEPLVSKAASPPPNLSGRTH
jgi:2-polyprenyl-6-methoxyphenol hydroxylase-like FAD-dependent oxidoreductase